jgi:hypothetical protein
MKRCTKCGQAKPESEFYVKYRNTGQLYSVCKPCWNAYKRARYHANPEPQIQKRMEWARRNRERVAATTKAWREANPERVKTIVRRSFEKTKPQRAAYRKANAERIKVWAAEYRKRKADSIREYGRAYYRANKSEVDVRVRKCIGKKPGLYKQLHKAAKHRRRVRLEGNGPCEVFADLEIFKRDGWRCGLCGEPVDPSLCYPDPMSASLDHVHPIAKGGGHVRANVQCAHLRCNLSKRDRRKVA